MKLEPALKLLSHRYLALVFRLYLGGLFIYASMYKISYAGEFAETVASYMIVPHWAVNPMAVLMPWLELVCGILLVAGFRAKSANAVIIGLLSSFTIAILVSLIRDTPIGCGCFHTLEENIDWTTLVRDLAWLGMAVHVHFFDSAFHLDRQFMIRLKDI